MSDFKEGQLVVTWSTNYVNRHIRIYVGKTTDSYDGREMYLCREAGESANDAMAYYHCAPLEDVEQNVFIALDLSLEQRLKLQVAWLCDQLDRLSQDTGRCLLPSYCGIPSDDSCRVGGCEYCWEKASLKAVKKENSNGKA